MTGVEIAQLATLVTAAGGILIGMFKIVASVGTAARLTSTNPPNHGPCNESVDKLTAAMHAEIREQQTFRLLFEKWMASEEGYRRGLRATGEHNVQGV